jgi:RHS repeat-associated protein
MTYTGNQLTGLREGSGPVLPYTYDANGNMTSDGRKNLQITYNVLNLQQSLSQNGTTVASYRWLADGTKCGVVDNNSSGYDYLGSLIYSRTGSTRTLESTDFGGGRIVYSGGTYNPYYYITDHLGSVRVITDNSGAVQERNDYYPFGGKHANSAYAQLPVNKYKFNGKELQTTGNTGFLDYGARMYDDVIGRWSVVDMMAEKYYNFNPYGFCANNPALYIDPNGQDWYSYSEKYKDENGEEKEKTQYKFSDEYRSQKDLDKAGIKGTYLGITYKTDDKYFSLLGEVLDAKDKNGNSNIGTAIVEKLDKAIINYYK